MSRRRLLFLIDRFGGFNGGTERHVEHLVKNLLDRELFEPFVVGIHRESAAEERFGGHAPYHALCGETAKIAFPALVHRVSGIIRTLKPAIVNSYFIDPYLAAGYAKYVCRFYWIHHLRNMGYFVDRRFRLLDSLARPNVDRYIVNSRAVAGYLRENYRVKDGSTEIIYNGVPAPLFQALPDRGETDGRFVVGTVANIRPVKGLEVLLEGAAICRRDIPNLEIVIVGDDGGDYAAGVKRSAREKGLDASFAGKQANVASFVSRFHVAVNTSRSEGFSNAVLEYMALGKAVVLSDGGGNPEAIEDGESGLLFRNGDAAHLAEKILLLYRCEELRRRLAANARERCRALFSEEETAKRYNELFACCDPG